MRKNTVTVFIMKYCVSITTKNMTNRVDGGDKGKAKLKLPSNKIMFIPIH